MRVNNNRVIFRHRALTKLWSYPYCRRAQHILEYLNPFNLQNLIKLKTFYCGKWSWYNWWLNDTFFGSNDTFFDSNVAFFQIIRHFHQFIQNMRSIIMNFSSININNFIENEYFEWFQEKLFIFDVARYTYLSTRIYCCHLNNNIDMRNTSFKWRFRNVCLIFHSEL